jgi:replicative DNA helicase
MTTQATYFNNAEDEMYLIGAILQHNEVLDRHRITRDLFYEEFHRVIFDAIQAIKNRGSTADIISVAQACPVYTVQIASCTNFLVGDIKGLVKRLRDCVQARGVARTIREISELQSDLKPAEEVVEEATRQILALTECRDVSYRPLLEVATAAIEEIKVRKSCTEEYSGVPSGLEPLDRMTDGFQNGDYILLGARPSIGKTALALTLAMNAALKGRKIGFMSLEMKDTALLKRMLAAASGVSMQAIRTGMIGPKALTDLINGAGILTTMKIFFGDVPNMAINDLIAESRILRSREKIDMLIIDYIGLITAGQGEAPRWEVFSAISQRIKSLARELNIPVLALSQLGRQSDGKRPGLADLRESGSLEQDADLILFLHREEKSNDQSQPVKLIVAKARNGETGDIDLEFDRSRMKFRIGDREAPRFPYKD